MQVKSSRIITKQLICRILHDLFLIGLVILLCVFAYSHSPNRPVSSKVSPSVGVRIVKHAMGETQVPAHPQRIVALDAYVLDAILSLGIKPVGAPRLFLQKKHLEHKAAGIKDIGWQPNNLEKILVLKPDLLLGSSIFHKDIYPLLSQIAPTVLVKLEKTGDWKQIFALVAETLGKEEVAAKVMTNYAARLAEFKSRMGRRLQHTQVSLLRVATDSISVFTKGAFAGTILEDAGLLRPSLQNLDVEATRRKGGNPIAYSISKELLNHLEGDILFVIKIDIGDVQSVFRQLKTEPLWSKLKVVQKGKVYEVKVHWTGTGPIAANRVIDDLFRYFLQEQ